MAEHEALRAGAIAEAHLLDGQVAGHLAVAAGALKGSLDLIRARAQLLGEHVVAAASLQVAASSGRASDAYELRKSGPR
ncbi:MAG TPA: hypothetical protein VJ787_08380, partial [Thermoleophilia bacterium]|nr:hypothetical protein [Thermoleophilia bacterium]